VSILPLGGREPLAGVRLRRVRSRRRRPHVDARRRPRQLPR
jgi:hypothetical protein